MMQFLTTIQFLQSCERLQAIDITFEELVLENKEEKTSIWIDPSDIQVETNLYIEDHVSYAQLLIHDRKQRIEQLLGEEYEVASFEVSAYDSMNHREIPVYFVSQLEQSDITSLRTEQISDFINGFYQEESVKIYGPKPDHLFGYDLSAPIYQSVALSIYKRCEDEILKNNMTYFVTTGRLGFETVAFFALEQLKKKYPNIKNILVLPYHNMDSVWPQDTKNRFQRMLQLADFVIEVDTLYDQKPIGEYTRSKLYSLHEFCDKVSCKTLQGFKTQYDDIRFSEHINKDLFF